MISPDVLLLLVMLACGAAVSLLFDFFKAIRVVFKPNTIIVAVSDALFCVIATLCAAACVWNFGGGAVRLYEIAGLFFGGLLYFLLPGRYVLRFFIFIFEKISQFTAFILKILLTPPQFLYKILVVPKLYIRKQGSRGTHDKRIQKNDN